MIAQRRIDLSLAYGGCFRNEIVTETSGGRHMGCIVGTTLDSENTRQLAKPSRRYLPRPSRLYVHRTMALGQEAMLRMVE